MDLLFSGGFYNVFLFPPVFTIILIFKLYLFFLIKKVFTNSRTYNHIILRPSPTQYCPLEVQGKEKLIFSECVTALVSSVSLVCHANDHANTLPNLFVTTTSITQSVLLVVVYSRVLNTGTPA